MLQRLIDEQHETNTRLLGCQIKMDQLIEQNKPIVITPSEPSPFMDKDGLYNYQYYKNRKKIAQGEDE